jgi:hypothetical protein
MIPRRWCCEFSDGSEAREIMVVLDPREIETSRFASDPDVVARAFALRHAYRQAPASFVHVAHGTSPILES